MDAMHAGILAGLSLVLVTVFDYLLGAEISVIVLYFLPVGMASKYGGRYWGIAVAVAAALGWYAADVTTRVYSAAWIGAWNGLIRMAAFIYVSELVARIEKTSRKFADMAQKDFLTGLNNARGFELKLAEALTMAKRYGRPFSLAYCDLDAFKAVNDKFGHSVGDELLKSVAESLQRNLRATDITARLGGDEFAVFLPETPLAQAQIAMDKVRRQLAEEMNAHGWPVSASIGVVGFTKPPASVDALLRIADNAMYAAKASGKNCLNVVEH